MIQNINMEKLDDLNEALHQKWSKLSDDELESANGDLNMISKLVGQSYGLSNQDARKAVELIFEKFEEMNSDEKNPDAKADKTSGRPKLTENLTSP